MRPFFRFFADKLILPVARLKMKVFYGIMYYFVLTPIGLLRGERLGLKYPDMKRESYLNERRRSQFDFERPY